ncbi:hypothetical protein [Phaeovulum sp.]|uniref:hypothetical protein n=1 Tax=Phaeovulum sp. TaxID=2934796 RepID=UPI0039E35472
MQLAHAFLPRRFLGKGVERFVFVLDADSGLALSFVSAFAKWIKQERADVIVVNFDKNQSNDQRYMLVNEGQEARNLATSISRSKWNAFTKKEKEDHTDAVI